MKILGISAFYHDSAAAFIDNGRIIAAAQEERFTRRKHDPRFPHCAIQHCLKTADIPLSKVDQVVFYEKPFLKFERLLETYLAFAPRGFRSFALAMPVWLKEKLFQKMLLDTELKKHDADFDPQRLYFSEHHLSHAASAFYPSPFNNAVVLTMDGVGEWPTTSVAIGEGRDLKVVKEMHFPHSLGFLYSAFTYYTGFKVNSGEYKLMGLAPYGEPKYLKQIYDHLADVKEDGSFQLNQDYFDYCTGLTMTNDKFADLFGGPARKPDELLTQKHMDLAASIQLFLEETVLKLTRSLHNEYKIDRLCMAGGVALNCVANGKILRDGKFKELWIQPAAGDAGGALGAALVAHHLLNGSARHITSRLDQMDGAYLGPEYSAEEIRSRLLACGAKLEKFDETNFIEQIAADLEAGKAVGWFQGRMEFGPRALGARSILGDPRSPNMQKMLNLKVKYRESFRPFAPSVLFEDAKDWFDLEEPSPYMLLVAQVREELCRKMSTNEEQLFGIDKLNVSRSTIPAVTHVDYSARIQTVHAETNPIYAKLIRRFKEKTGCSVIVNTSFNVRGEPIVCTPEDAFRCFMGTEIETLAIGPYILRKEAQPEQLSLDYKNMFELD